MHSLWSICFLRKRKFLLVCYVKNMKSEEKLQEAILKLSERIKRRNSLKWTLVRGVIRGVGAAIGAAVLASAVLALVSWFLGGIGLSGLLS
jgi:hypothetical protein